MHSNLKAIILSVATCVSMSAMAVDTLNKAPDHTENAAQQEKRALKTESKAEYKARKDVAEVNKDLEIADCKTSGLESKDVRDCKHEARENAKAVKHEAKEIYKEDKANIKARTSE